MDLRNYNIKDFEENTFYHLVIGEKSIDKSRVYFTKDDILFELKMMGEPKASDDTYNFINKANFVKANVSLKLEQLPKWTKVEALIHNKWVKRYFYSYKEILESVTSGATSVIVLKDRELIVTPCSEEMFDNKFIEYADSVRVDEKDRYKALIWS